MLNNCDTEDEGKLNDSTDKLRQREESSMDWTESGEKREKSPRNGFVQIKKEVPDLSGLPEWQPEWRHGRSDMRIKEEVWEDNNPSSERNESYWFDRHGPNNLPGERPAPTQSTLDTLQSMVRRFDGTAGDLKPQQEGHPRAPLADQFSSPCRNQSLPWTDRNLSPYSYPYFSVGLTSQSSSSTDSPKQHLQLMKEYPCKKCTFKANSKDTLDEHLKEEHYKVSCSLCNYIATSQGRMTRHMEVAHGGREDKVKDTNGGNNSPNTSDDNTDVIALLGSKVLKKPKKCKLCKENFNTKNEYYDHMYLHFPSLMKCEVRQCRFVTNLPHHMRYHMGLHRGTKDFRCTDCNYTCATKSMLKSHMKCHDTVCRYRCSTCCFSAKHANALNNHLQKTGHVPGPVLSSDGSIPVDDPNSRFENHVRKKPYSSSSLPFDTPPNLGPVEENAKPVVSELASSEDGRRGNRSPVPRSSHSPFLPPMSNPFLQSPVFPPLQMAHVYMQNMHMMNNLMQHNGTFGMPVPWGHGLPSKSTTCNLCGRVFLNFQVLMHHVVSGECKRTDLKTEPSHHYPPSDDTTNGSREDDNLPIDLSIKKTNKHNSDVLHKKTEQTEKFEEPTVQRKSRRKGIAQKLDLTAIKRQTDFEAERDVTDENCDNRNIPEHPSQSCCDRIPFPDKRPRASTSLHSHLPDLEPIVKHEPFQSCSEEQGYSCNFCQVVFKDRRMFAAHVSLHCPSDPFRCLGCGRTLGSGSEFFQHLSEFEHNTISPFKL